MHSGYVTLNRSGAYKKYSVLDIGHSVLGWWGWGPLEGNQGGELRALSSGGSITSPPLSPALPKYKLADYRYGREEMLALFLKDNKIPSDLLDKEFLPILQEEPLPPLALVPFTEEEQVCR
uniref:GRB10 interacting GYF protein 2 n=2 Tax=Ursus TaxID=9639 RepID=A0A452UK91_URSMA